MSTLLMQSHAPMVKGVMKDTEKTAFSRRLHEALDAADIPHRGRMRRLAELAGVSDNAAKKWLEGQSIPNRERWEELACAIGADWRWLFIGEPASISTQVGRLIKRWRNDQNPTVSLPSLSKRAGIPLLRLSFIEEGKAALTSEEMYRLGTELGIDIVAEAAKPSPEEYEHARQRYQLEQVLYASTNNAEGVLVPVFSDVMAAAGNGILAPDTEIPSEFIWVRADRLTSVSEWPDRISIIRASGDSMQPSFSDGDWLIIDRPEAFTSEMFRDGIYVFRVGDELFVKRLQRLPGGRCLAISDNKAYEPFEINLADDNVQIIARVVLAWTAKTL